MPWPLPSTLYTGPILAPMVRASFPGIRMLTAALGASAVYTGAIVGDSLRDAVTEVNQNEMIVRISTARRSAGSPSCVIISVPIRPTETPGKFEPAIPLVVQLTVNEHDDINRICNILAPWCVGIDLNLGCGAQFAISGGRGQRLMDKAEEVVIRFLKALQQIENSGGRRISFSIKQRLLSSIEETIDKMRTFYNLGVNCIAVHMRRKGEERSCTHADWSSFFQVLSGLYTWLWTTFCQGNLQFFKDALRTFHVVANGDLFSRETILEFFALSEQYFSQLPIEIQPYLSNRYGRLTPVMLARGAISDLTLFSFIIEQRGESAKKVDTSVPVYISEARSLLQPINEPVCYLNQAKALLKVSEATSSHFNSYKYTLLNGIAFVRSHEIYKSNIQRLAYKYFNQELQAPKTYREYHTLLDRLSSQPYSYWATLLKEQVRSSMEKECYQPPVPLPMVPEQEGRNHKC